MAKLFSDREIRAIAVFLPLAGLLIIALMLVRPAADPEAARRAEAEMEEALPADSVVMSHFDPNTASLDDLRRLGLTKHEAVSLLKYRAAGKVFRIPEDLTLCYGISDSLYRRLEPWVLGKHPYIAPQALRKLLKARQLKGGWSTAGELVEQNILTREEAARLAPYLQFGSDSGPADE